MRVERERIIALAVIALAAIVCLTVLAVAYWLIMRQDATALTATAATIGGALGYAVRYLADRRR